MILYANLNNRLLNETNRILSAIREEQFSLVVQTIIQANRVFIHGAGRSGLAGRFLAMRLMHTGKVVYMAGDTTTPAIRKNDLLILVSGSGDTPSVLQAAAAGKAAGCTVLAFTGQGEKPAGNPLAALADLAIQLAVPAINRNESGIALFPLGTLFELSVLLFLETVVAAIIDTLQIKESDMQARHANLE